MIKIRCNSCSKLLKLSVDKVPEKGIQVKCPSCNNTGMLPGPEKKTADASGAFSIHEPAVSGGNKVYINCPQCQASFFIREKNLPGHEIRIKCRKCQTRFLYRKPVEETQVSQSKITRETAKSIMWDLLEEDEKKEVLDHSAKTQPHINADMEWGASDTHETGDMFDDKSAGPGDSGPSDPQQPFGEEFYGLGEKSALNSLIPTKEFLEDSDEEDWLPTLKEDVIGEKEQVPLKQPSGDSVADSGHPGEPEKPDAPQEPEEEYIDFNLDPGHEAEKSGDMHTQEITSEQKPVDSGEAESGIQEENIRIPDTPVPPEIKHGKVIPLPRRDKSDPKRYQTYSQTQAQEDISDVESEDFKPEPVSETVEEPAPQATVSRVRYKWGLLLGCILAIIYLVTVRGDLVRSWFVEPAGFLFSGYMEKAAYRKGEELYAKKNYELALNAVDRALENNPTNTDYRSLKIACKLWLNPGLLKEITVEGACALRGLTDMLERSTDVQIQAKTVDAMGRLGNPAVIPLLEKTFHSEIPNDLKRIIVEAFGSLKDPASIPALREALTLKDTTIRFAACASLGEIGSQEGARALEDAVRDEDFTVRYKAAEALRKIGGETSAGILVNALDDPNVENKENILISLGKIRDQNAVPAVGRIFRKNLMDNGDLLLRHAATVSLGEIGGPEAFGILKEALLMPETPDKQDIVAALGKIDGSEVITTLIEIIEDRRNYNRTVKKEAAYSLLEKGDPDTIPVLEQAVKKGFLDKTDLEITLRKNFP